MFKCVLSEQEASLYVCECVRQEVVSGAADGLSVHFDNKGKRLCSLLFDLGSPEETPLFLRLLDENYT